MKTYKFRQLPFIFGFLLVIVIGPAANAARRPPASTPKPPTVSTDINKPVISAL